MRMRRRSLLASAGSLALTHNALAQVVTGGGAALSSGGQAMTPAPPAPPVAGGGGTGALLDRQVTFYNPASQGAARTSPFVSFGHLIAPGEFPATGYKAVLMDSTDTTQICELQVDQACSQWTDRSKNFAVFSGTLTGQTIASGANPAYRVKVVSGIPNTAPVCTLAQLQANSNLNVVCSIGADTYTVSINTIAATYGAPGSTTNPVGYVQQWKYGPQCCEWEFGQYLKRDSDGAQHGFVMLRVYVTALSPTGPFILRHELTSTNAYANHPSGTLGGTTFGQMFVIDKIEYFDGATFLNIAHGGVNDPNSANTFPPSAINTAAAGIANSAVTYGATFYNAYVPVGFTNSGGALPAGVGSFSTTTYWLWYDGANLIPFTSKIHVAKMYYGPAYVKKVITSGVAVTTTSYCISNGAYYLCTSAGTGTSDGTPPSGATFTDTHNVTWTQISANLSTQGTGTHRMTMKVSCAQYGKCAGMRRDSRPYWYGAGTYPKLLPGYDVAYITQKAIGLLPYDTSIVCKPWQGAGYGYQSNYVYSIPQFIGQTGESPTDERICPMSPSAVASMLLPTDEMMADWTRIISLSFMDRQYYIRDERAQTVLVANSGPGRVAGSNYINMAPSNPSYVQPIGSVTGGSPLGRGPYSGNPADYNGYGQSGGPSPDSMETSHVPLPHYWPYLSSGDPIFLNACMENATAAMGQQQASWRSYTTGGLTYTFPCVFNVQARQTAWHFRMFEQTSWVVPDNHQAFPYFRDLMDDGGNQMENWLRTQPTDAVAHGWFPTTYTSITTTANEEPWMVGYFLLNIAQHARKGVRPGYKSLLSNYFPPAFPQFWDSDFTGTEFSADTQALILANTTANPPPNGSWYTSTQAMLAGATTGTNGSAYTNDPYPPPGGIVVGLTMGTSKPQHYAYYTAPITACNYFVSARCMIITGAAAGDAECLKVANRLNAALAKYYPIQFMNGKAGSDGSGN